jgi:hypothetical protein
MVMAVVAGAVAAAALVAAWTVAVGSCLVEGDG